MRRIFSSILVIAMVFTCCCGAAAATDAPDTRASLTLSTHSAVLKAGSSRGTVSISFDVRTNKLADFIGVESIDIYKSDGSFVTSITGTTGNGLIYADSNIYKEAYSYTGISGVSYYAEVLVFAEVGSSYDSRTITTATVKAP